ncbi:hypothetical protein CDD83_2822 [Cordyceps sp. RAO-2017]|nr:hypothetical protein CDD83_2822 [Cordyceps sp. RAO-2017]
MQAILFLGFLAPIVTGNLNLRQDDASFFKFPACAKLHCYDALDDYTKAWDKEGLKRVCKDFSEGHDTPSIDTQGLKGRCKADPTEDIVWKDVKEACECVLQQ